MTLMQVLEIGSVGKSGDQGVKMLFAHATGVRFVCSLISFICQILVNFYIQNVHIDGF